MSHRKNNSAGTAPARITISVTGMTCANCVRHVENSLGGKDGILSVAVSLSKGQATVVYDPAGISPDEIKHRIMCAGYGVR